MTVQYNGVQFQTSEAEQKCEVAKKLQIWKLTANCCGYIEEQTFNSTWERALEFLCYVKNIKGVSEATLSVQAGKDHWEERICL